MPTINEVWEQALQINANLGTLHNDSIDLKKCCTETNAKLTDLHPLLAQGFASVTKGIAGVHARQDETNRLLLHQSQQLATVICVLEHISRNTCELVNDADEQIRLQRTIAEAADGLEHMFATANGAAATALAREREHRQQIEACCEQPQPQPPCAYEPCAAPDPDVGATPREGAPGATDPPPRRPHGPGTPR